MPTTLVRVYKNSLAYNCVPWSNDYIISGRACPERPNVASFVQPFVDYEAWWHRTDVQFVAVGCFDLDEFSLNKDTKSWLIPAPVPNFRFHGGVTPASWRHSLRADLQSPKGTIEHRFYRGAVYQEELIYHEGGVGVADVLGFVNREAEAWGYLLGQVGAPIAYGGGSAPTWGSYALEFSEARHVYHVTQMNRERREYAKQRQESLDAYTQMLGLCVAMYNVTQQFKSWPVFLHDDFYPYSIRNEALQCVSMQTEIARYMADSFLQGKNQETGENEIIYSPRFGATSETIIGVCDLIKAESDQAQEKILGIRPYEWEATGEQFFHSGDWYKMDEEVKKYERACYGMLLFDYFNPALPEDGTPVGGYIPTLPDFGP